jgi:hypothetical protein
MTLASEALFREITSKEVPLATPGDEVLETHLENATARDVGGGVAARQEARRGQDGRRRLDRDGRLPRARPGDGDAAAAGSRAT